MTIQETLNKYMDGKTFRQFTDQVNAFLPSNFGYSQSYWHKVSNGSYKPNYYAVYYLSGNASGWVRDFATELMREMGRE